MSINIIETNTNKRLDDAKKLFLLIQPLLDEGYLYSTAIKKVKKLPESYSLNRHQYAWYREVIEYGETQGYPYHEYMGKENNYHRK